MIDALSISAVWELERALTNRLRRQVTPAEQRVAELGFLAELLARSVHADVADGPFRVIPRFMYDERQPPTSPSSHLLVDAYGSWRNACRAADGLLPDGRTTGLGKPWRSPRGHKRGLRYTNEDVLGCVRACAQDLLRRPSSSDYYRWSRARRAYIRATGAHLIVVDVGIVIRRFGGWPRALAAACITDQDLAAWREQRVPADAAAASASGPRAALGQTEPAALVALGIDEALRERLTADGFGELKLDQAVACAHAFKSSLDWLAERSRERGQPVALTARLNGTKFVNLRRDRNIPEKRVRQRLGLPLGPYRQLVSGTRQPTFDQLITLASLVGQSLDELVQ